MVPFRSALRLESGPGPIKYALSFFTALVHPKVRLPLIPVTYETGNTIVAALTDLDLID